MSALPRPLAAAALAAATLLCLAGPADAQVADPGLRPASATALTATEFTITATRTVATPGTTVTVTAQLFESDTRSAISGVVVHLHRKVPGSADEVTDVITGATGTASMDLVVAPTKAANTVYAVYDATATHAGTTSASVTIAPDLVHTTTTLTGPARPLKTSQVALTAQVSADGGPTPGPVAAAKVAFQRLTAGHWRTIATVTADAHGTAVHKATVSPVDAANQFRAVFTRTTTLDPSTSPILRMTGQPWTPQLLLTGPDQVIDEHSATLRVVWKTKPGTGVDATVKIYRYADGTWAFARTLDLGPDGQASFPITPRVDTAWKAVGAPGAWWAGDTSNVHRVDNVPPGRVVHLPAGAPAPRIQLPAQARAAGTGANPVVSPIPDTVWSGMVGRSWHAGCPVGRDALRLVRVNYWGYDGYRHRGELVVNAGAAETAVRAFSAMYAHRFPIRSMYLVDRFGWSDRVHGADDYASMAAGNTSAFNCRNVVGRPGVTSPHATGYAFDINPWENPYRSQGDGWVPNTYWTTHTLGALTWRSATAPVVSVLRGAGLHWTYGLDDIHHFDA